MSFDNPWWGMTDDDLPPPRKELFGGSQFDNQMRLEDFFQHNRVFMNGFGEQGMRTCHADSYGTIVMFEHLEAALTLLDEQYSPTAEDWRPHAEAWAHGENMQPPLRLVGRMIAARCGITLEPQPDE